MIINTILKKLIVSNGNPIQYQLFTEDGLVQLNGFIGKKLLIKFTGNIFCKNCGKPTKKSFNQGFCYPCFRRVPEAAPCIIRPELCRAHLGEGRDVDWEQRHHNQPHLVYFAVGSAIKVGVTSTTNIPNRWIDQGASSAVSVAHTPNRYLAGRIEVELKKYFTDRIHWQKMLRNEVLKATSFQEAFKLAQTSLPAELRKYLHLDNTIFTGRFPVTNYPSKIVSINLDKSTVLEGILTGIKGQYLMFDAKKVINIRKHEGYEVIINFP